MWVEETKNGKFRLYERYVDPLIGKKKKASVMMDKNTPQAINKARPLLLDKIANKTNIELLNTKDITLKELCNEFMEFKAPVLSDSSITSYRLTIRNIIAFIGPDAIINSISTKILQRYFLTMSDKYKLSTIQQYAIRVKAIFGFAVKNQYITDNPMNNVELSSKINDFKNDDDKYLTKSEREELLKVAYQCNIRYALLIEWLLNSGMRVSEAVGLQYKKIDGDEVIINEQLQNKKLTPLKTISSNRKIKMTERMKWIVKKENEINSPTSDNDFIFKSASENPIMKENLNIFLNRISKHLSFDKHIHSHTFRHTHISILAENNINIKSIMKRVGHSSPNTTMEIYTHVTERMNKELESKLNEIF